MTQIDLLLDIQKNIDLLSGKMNDLKTDINEISTCLENKTIIPNETADRVIFVLREINDLNDSCRKIYSEIDNSRELPVELANIESLISKAINDYELDNKLASYKIFLKLYSDDAKIMELLNSHKTKLNEILNNYTDEKESELIPYRRFVEAVTETDQNKLFSYGSELMPVFGGNLVGAAIFTRSVYLKEDDKESVISPVSPIVEDAIKELDVSEEQPISQTVEIAEIESETTSVSDTDVEEIVPTPSHPELCVPSDLFPNGFKQDYSSLTESRRSGTKIFINELKQRNVPSNVAVMSFVDRFGIVTPDLIAFTTSAPLSVISDACSYLKKKGYLRVHFVEGVGEYYCASPRGLKALQAQDARKFLKLRNNNSSSDEIIEPSLFSVLTRLSMAQMLTSFFMKGNTDYQISSVYTLIECFASVVRNKDNDRKIMFAGSFWNKMDEEDTFFTEVNNKCDECQCYVISSANGDLAKRNAEYFIEKLSLDENEVFYYSLIEEELRSFTTDENVTMSTLIESYGEEENSEDNCIIDNESDYAPETVVETESEPNDLIVEPEITVLEPTSEVEVTPIVEKHIVDNTIDNSSIVSNVYRMIINDKTYCATTYLRSLMDDSSEIKKLYEQLAFAVNAPWMKCSYSSSKIFELYSVGESVFSDYLLVSASMRNFFMNHTSFDYQVKALQNNIKNIEFIANNTALVNAMYKIALFKEEVFKGIDFYADYRVKDQVAMDKALDSLRNEAKSYYDSYVCGQPKNHKGVKRFVETWKLIFSMDHEFASFLKAIIEKDYEFVDLMKDYLSENFIIDDCSIEYSNLDMNKLNFYIDNNWDSTYGSTGSQYKTSNLMSDLRNNLINAIEKVIKVSCEWISIVENSVNNNADEGSIRYRESKADLVDELNEALESVSLNDSFSDEEKAGCIILKNTIKELMDRMTADYSDNNHKYYYIDFLRGDYVWLDEQYLPDMSVYCVDLPDMSLPNRILAHAKSTLISFEDKLEKIFNGSDDYGSAKLIIDYLAETGIDIDASEYDIDASEKFANDDAKVKLAGFVENLELAQSYGQIEEATENVKEKLHKSVNECYEYATLTRNYSFFVSVLNGYTKKIREDAKVRGKALHDELTRIKNSGSSTDIKDARILKIEEAIEEQNYTVAEDLLSRIDDVDDDTYEVSRVDYLKKFIDEYDRDYKDVNDSSKKLSAIVQSKLHQHNKDSNGARRLVDNWMSNGKPMNISMLTYLLDAMGFANATPKEQPKINGKIVNFLVTIKNPSGVKVNYKHPIAAFGSKAFESGFRVVCLFGKYDADRLVEEFKNISGGKNTLVLLDYALPLNERRRLARKIKSDLGDKVFAIVDRVLLMYLVNNYSVQFINQIMMATMMPFAYCQPYVWDSSKVMPPEIFMGRKEELEKIESPEGVNIVYGGRQLGKSALLKMARLNIDHDENSNRAVYIEIKGLNYKAAAKKIGHELYDAGILKEDINTEDWDDLSRAIKRRLTDNKAEYIPYLLLLLDEADTFIESSYEVAFRPFDALKDIQSIGSDRFKFVIAGLHNIVRFKRDAALSNNSVLTHLSSITITPFSVLEARQLLEEPLYYLGLRFPNDRDISTILANTNYFPGLIQLYCANLIESMRKNDYAGYSESDSPVYNVTTNHFKKVLSDPKFTDQIKEKFEITLKLDEDNMYYIIALLMSYLYHLNSKSVDKRTGYSSEDIIKAANDFSIKKVIEQKPEAIDGLMQELEELNIFRQTVDKLYLFSRYSFFQMMGTLDEVEEKIMEYMED